MKKNNPDQAAELNKQKNSAAADVNSPEGRVPLKENLAIGSGALAAFYGFDGVGRMALPVYNILLGLPAQWVSLALMLPRLWDAITDPVMGIISDNARTRWGRRRPFIVIGALLMGVFFALIWQVESVWLWLPESWQNGLGFDRYALFWLIAMQILYFTAYTVFSVPYNALTYEMTPDYRERNRVMSFVGFFHKLGELTSGWAIPLATAISIILAADAGGLSMAGVVAVGWLIGLFVMGGMGSLPGIIVGERFQKQPTERKVRIWKSLQGAFSSLPFLILMAVIVLNTLAGVLASGIDQYVLIYYMNDGDFAAGMIQKGLLTTGYGVMGFVSIPLISWLAGKLDKKGALYFVYGLMLVGSIMKWFIFRPGHPLFTVFGVTFDPIILIDPLLCGPMWVAVKILLASMMADICDEDELKHGQRREGIFGAAFSWVEKILVSVAYAGAGLALWAAGFDLNLGGQQTAETFTKMRLFLSGAPALSSLFAIIALYFYPIDEKRANATREQLEARRGSIDGSRG